MKHVFLPLPEAIAQIRAGDVGLFGPTTWGGRWIYRLARSWASHACMFFWEANSLTYKRTLWEVEQIFPVGRTIPAEPYLEGCPSGSVRIYRPTWKSWQAAAKAVNWARQHAPGVRYDSKRVWRGLLSHLPFLRWWIRPSEDDEAEGNGEPRPLYCSALVARAARLGGGLDLVPGLSDHWTEPGDLAKSAAMQYQFTIVLEEGT